MEERIETLVEETAKAVKGFEAAARKIERQIKDLRNGDVGAEAVYRAVYRLEERTNAPEIRGATDAREACQDRAAQLRRAIAPAADAGRSVIRMRREVAADRLAPSPRCDSADARQYRLELALGRL